jgi:hypothetical protein
MERRKRPDRRAAPEGRRETDYTGGFTLSTFLFALCGALVVVYLFFVALGSVDTTEQPGWAIAALILGLIWLAHSWQRLWAGNTSPRADRERRGF